MKPEIYIQKVAEVFYLQVKVGPLQQCLYLTWLLELQKIFVSDDQE